MSAYIRETWCFLLMGGALWGCGPVASGGDAGGNGGSSTSSATAGTGGPGGMGAGGASSSSSGPGGMGAGGASSSSSGDGGMGSGAGGSGGGVVGFVDCNKDPSDGDEVDLDNDPQNCGVCGWICPTGICTGGLCYGPGCNKPGDPWPKPYLYCEWGRKDCNGVFSDGCEVNIKKDPANCGACGVVCPTGFCENTECKTPPVVGGLGACPAGYLDCDLDPANGCETDVASDPLNCGDCLHACPTAGVGSHAICTFGTCEIACNPGYDEGCFTGGGGGCQPMTGTPNGCGACGINCAGGACVNGACTPAPVPIASAPNSTTDFALGTSHLYLLDISGDIYRTPLEGGCPEMVVAGQGAKNIRINGSYLYFETATDFKRWPLTGGAPEVAWTPGEAYTSVDFTNAYVYWANSGTYTIKRAPIGGSAGQTVLVDTISDLVSDESFIYYASGTAIKRLPVLGGPAQSWGYSAGAAAGALKLEPDTVYWFKSGQNGMAWMGKDKSFSGGTPPTKMYVGDACSNDTYVYVSTMPVTGPYPVSYLRRYGKKTSLSETIIAEYGKKVAANNTGVYVFTGGRVGKLSP